VDGIECGRVSVRTGNTRRDSGEGEDVSIKTYNLTFGSEIGVIEFLGDVLKAIDKLTLEPNSNVEIVRSYCRAWLKRRDVVGKLKYDIYEYIRVEMAKHADKARAELEAKIAGKETT
jgi:hypothetical protein